MPIFVYRRGGTGNEKDWSETTYRRKVYDMAAKANCQEQLIEWKNMFGRPGLRVCLGKVEVLWGRGDDNDREQHGRAQLWGNEKKVREY